MTAKIIVAIFTCLELHLLVQGYVSINSSTYDDMHPIRRILHGQVADVSSFRFLVRLQIGPMLCGGSIISNEWIMTAGHCIYGKPCFGIQIFPAVWQPTRFVQPVECFNHARYRLDDHRYDIGLLRVLPDFRRDGATQIIPLPAPGTFFPPGTPAVIAGWGETETAAYPDIILRADVQVREWGFCQSLFYGNMARRVLCTQDGGDWPSGTCFGDSGGPVIINGVVAGISSFVLLDGQRCRIGSPSMHVNVVDYLPWIYSFIDPARDTSRIPVQPEN